MKKQYMKTAFVLGLLIVAVCCSGCLRRTKPSEQENVIKFGSFTQEERKDYINDFLWENYGFRGEVGEVMQRQISPFKWEDHYFTTVDTPEYRYISVWVSKKGEITDTLFLKKMEPEITKFFSAIIAEEIPDFKLKTHTDIYDIPSEKLTKAENIKDFLTKENAEVYVDVFVEDSGVIDEGLLDRLEQKLNFCKITLRIYTCDDLENCDIDTYDQTAYIFKRYIDKMEVETGDNDD